MRARSFLTPRLALVVTATELSLFLAFTVLYLTPLTPHAVWESAGGPSTLIFVLPFAAFAAIAGLIAFRRPENRVGWTILAAGGSLAVGALTDLAASLLVAAHNPAGAWVGLGGVLWSGGISATSFLFVLALLSFPDGRLPSRRWRWLLYVTGFGALVTAAIFVLDPTPGLLGIGFTSDTSVNAASPLAVKSLGGITSALTATPLISAGQYVLEILALGSVFLRLRGADSERRHQIRWFGAGASLSVVGLAVTGFLPNPANPTPGVIALYSAITLIGNLAMPVAVAVAMLKYRLYDIDIVINRALVYGVLAVFITSVYIGIAVGIGSAVGSGGKPNLGLSILATAIVAVGFQPLRQRLQRVANRVVYGKRSTPYEALSEFAGQVADAYAADEVLPRMARVLRDGTGADAATVWLREGAVLVPAATAPDRPAGHEPLLISGDSLPAFPGASHAREVRHQGDLLGALSLVKRAGESLTPIEQNLVDDLARQAGLVLRNVGLTTELVHRIEELRASRQRLVSAQDEERRRLERNLHDGAQQHLVAIKVKLGLAEMLAARDPERARATLAELKGDADEALETLRDLARGIYPPLLADRGLAAALESQARKATVPVTVESDGVGRYPQEVEAAVYFCCLEALQNVQKYARASHVAIRMRDLGGELRFAVEDDGAGFDTRTMARGAGLTNMEDRLESLGGSLEIVSTAGNGTTVHGCVPVSAAAPGVATARLASPVPVG